MWEKSKQILNLSMLLFKKLGVLKHAESKFWVFFGLDDLAIFWSKTLTVFSSCL